MIASFFINNLEIFLKQLLKMWIIVNFKEQIYSFNALPYNIG